MNPAATFPMTAPRVLLIAGDVAGGGRDGALLREWATFFAANQGQRLLL
jgi:hypothetical protein